MLNSRFFLFECPVFGAICERYRNAVGCRCTFSFSWSALLVVYQSPAAARRDSSDDEPPARATSAASKLVGGRYAVGEAIRSLWPELLNPLESLPAMPVLALLGVQNNCNTNGKLLAWNGHRFHRSALALGAVDCADSTARTISGGQSVRVP